MRTFIALAVWVIAGRVYAGPAADWLPDDTVYFANIDRVARLKERARKGPLGALWSDPALRALTSGVEARFAGRRDDVGPLDLFDLVQGEVAVAGLPRADGVANVAFIDAGPRTLPFRSLLELYHRQQTRGQKITEQVVPCRGRSILVRRRGREVSAYVWLGTVVCFSESVAALQEVIALRAVGPERRLATSPAFRAARAAFPATDLFVYASARYWRDALGFAPARSAALGLDGVRGFAGGVTLRPDGVRTDLLVQTEGPRRGVLGLLDAPVGELGPPAFLPAGVGASFTASLDYRALAALALEMADADVRRRVADEVAALKRHAGIDVKGLVTALDGELTVAFLPPSWSRSFGSDSVMDAAAPWGDMVAILKVRRRGRVERFLDRVDAAAGGLPQHEYEGVRILFLPGERLGVVALLDDHLVLGATLDAVRTLIRARTSLRDTAVYRRASTLVPAARTVFTFTDPHARSGPSLQWLALKSARPDLLPLLEGFEKYRDISTFALSSRADGLAFTWFMGVRRP